MDDTVKISSLSSRQWGVSINIGSVVTGVAVGSDVIIASALEHVAVIKGGKVAFKLDIKYNATAVAVSSNQKEVAVGGKDFKIYLYKLEGDKLSPTKTLERHRGAITRLEYSPDGRYLAVGDANREVIVWENGEPKITGWVFHTAKVNAIAWCPDNTHLATASLDSNLIIWNVKDQAKRIDIKRAHPLGAWDVVWIDANTLASAGQDCSLKTWNINY